MVQAATTIHVADAEELPLAAPETLHLVVTDLEVLAELRRVPVGGGVRQRFALEALRIGVLSMRAAAGELDARAVRDAGQQLLAELKEILGERVTMLTGTLAGTLAQYFHPTTGVATRHLDGLTKDGGELERLLRAHVGNESTLAQTLADHIGESSPLFRMLSPGEASGLMSQVKAALSTALRDQSEHVLRQFSLDSKDSALSRLVQEVTSAHRALSADMKGQVQGVLGEFSLDRPDSALSRLVGRVEVAQQKISDEFSLDNETSALNKLTELLADTSAKIDRNLTLDDEASGMSRLRRELVRLLSDMEEKQTAFAAVVKAEIATMTAQRAERARGTRHGEDFEVAVGDVLAAEAQRLGDIHEATGARPGQVRNCKVGDHVISLGPESPAPAARIVIEAKQNKSVDLAGALAETDTARKNRRAQVGIFVFSKQSAPAGLEPLARYKNSVVVMWDPEDSSLDWVLRAAYSVARALVVRETASNDQTTGAVLEIERATRAIEKHVKRAVDIKRHASTIVSAGDKIVRDAEKMEQELAAQIADLDEQVAALRRADEP